MATNLPPELLKLLIEAKFDPASYINQMGKKSNAFGVNVATGETDKGYYDAASNRNYAPVYSQSGNPENGEMTRTLTGYNSYDPKADVKDATNYMYDTKGNSTGEFKSNDFLTMEPGEMIALLGIMAMTGGAAASAMAPAGAAAGGAAGAAGDAFLPGALAANGGAAVPYGSLLPGLEGYAAAGASGLANFNPAMDSQAANVGISQAGGNPLAGYGGTGGVAGSPLAGAGGGGGSWTDKLTSLVGGGGGSLGNLGGLAATALGGIAGSQGQSADTSSTKNLPPWLQAAVADELIPMTRQQFKSQVPIAQQAGQYMRTQGANLINAPVAGNGFSRFYGA